MTERLALAKDVKGRIICVGDLVTHLHHGEIYIVRLISGPLAHLEPMSNPGQTGPITLQTLSQVFEAVLCNACSKKLQIGFIEVTNVEDKQVLVSAPELVRCNACKYRLLANRIDEYKIQGGGEPT